MTGDVMVQIEGDVTQPKKAPRGLLSGMILLGIGMVFLVREMGYLEWNEFGPWLLIVIGGALVINYFARRY